MNANMPKRKFTLTIELGADDYPAMLSALENWILGMRLNYPTLDVDHNGVSGGYDAGYSYAIVIHHGMTHERYFKELDAYLEAKRQDDKP